MTYLFFGIGLFLTAYLFLNWVANAPPKSILKSVKWFFLGAVGLIGLLLVATGKFGLIWVLLVGALPWISRFMNLRRIFKTMAGPSAGNTSSVKTRFLDMTLHQDTGQMDGRVLEGRFEDRLLSQMTLDELKILFDEVAPLDRQSAELLDTYADRLYGDAWRAADEQTDQQHGQQRTGRAGGGVMTREEALAVLGLDEGADTEAIKEAHRRMMKQAHPDAGGSDYLAAKVNQAKDVLLGGKS